MKTSLERYLKILLKRWIVRNSNAHRSKQYSWTLSLIKDLTVIILLITAIIVIFLDTITYKIASAKWIASSSINQTAFYVPRSSQQQLRPLCTEGIMDKRIMLTDWEKNLYSHFPLNHMSDCRLHLYTQSDIVTCIEALNSLSTITRAREGFEAINTNKKVNTTASITGTKIKTHIAFVGNSRMRHMYGNFVIQLLPFFEDCSIPYPPDIDGNQDICLELPLMDTLFTFHWLPYFDDDYYKLLREWVDGKSPFPAYLVIGSPVWNIKLFGGLRSAIESNLTRLAPLLSELNERYGTRIVFYNDDQSTLIDEKRQLIKESNTVAHRVLKENKINLEFWDSTNDLYMGYIKMCDAQDERYARNTPWKPLLLDINRSRWLNWAFPTGWLNCFDYLHPPQAYGMNTMQLIANDLCNSVVTTI